MNDVARLNKELFEELKLKNVNEIPEVLSITLNIGVGASKKEELAYSKDILAMITGQTPITTNARKSIAGFSIREGWPLGTKVTLRRESMKRFQDKLVSIILPATRDFEGLNPNSFDGRGNYSFGIKDYTVFSEIPFNNNSFKIGMDVCIATSATNDDDARLLLTKLGYPFNKRIKIRRK